MSDNLILCEKYFIQITFLLTSPDLYNLIGDHEDIRDAFSRALKNHFYFREKTKIHSVYMELDDKYLCFDIEFNGKAKKIAKILKVVQKEIGKTIETYPLSWLEIKETRIEAGDRRIESIRKHLMRLPVDWAYRE
jgi:hypothetical protein